MPRSSRWIHVSADGLAGFWQSRPWVIFGSRSVAGSISAVKADPDKNSSRLHCPTLRAEDLKSLIILVSKNPICLVHTDQPWRSCASDAWRGSVEVKTPSAPPRKASLQRMHRVSRKGLGEEASQANDRDTAEDDQWRQSLPPLSTSSASYHASYSRSRVRRDIGVFCQS